ncbi:DUF5937 family protein [Brevibacillus dissolubilis]|uniref:DUF5937 family protein n=1 Tax=Brevibacillus dissolubilis TaxID=1844116 RepID=UPI0011179871|nr:DUF5937 family protein [Brevibacillus dissolubilis]
MITIGLAPGYELGQMCRFSVSPLFEMAASLHTLAQRVPHALHQQWCQETRDKMQKQDIHTEWLYFAPVFAESIPTICLPLGIEDVLEMELSIETVYDQVGMIPDDVFIESVTESVNLYKWERQLTVLPIEIDLEQNPAAVKSRFTLFISSYLRLIFHPLWEEFAHTISTELGQAKKRTDHPEELAVFLQNFAPTVRYLEESKSFRLAGHGEELQVDAQEVVLYVSWFLSQRVIYYMSHDAFFILYNTLLLPTSEQQAE